MRDFRVRVFQRLAGIGPMEFSRVEQKMKHSGIQSVGLHRCLAQKCTPGRGGLKALCLLLGAALACSALVMPDDLYPPHHPAHGGYTVLFDKNGGDTEAQPPSKTVVWPATTIDALPAAPTRWEHAFVGWNTKADGMGSGFTENTAVGANLIVFAQWERTLPRLELKINPPAATLTPMTNERSATFTVEVSGFESSADAKNAQLSILRPLAEGVEAQLQTTVPGENATTFSIRVTYNGTAPVPGTEGSVGLQLDTPRAADAAGYAYGQPTLPVAVFDGQTENTAIPVHKGNIARFNAYANTSVGLGKCYKLTEDVELASGKPNWTPVGQLYWTPTGAVTAPFTGRFDGGGHSIANLHIADNTLENQGLFGYVSRATIQNLGLKGGSITARDSVGGLVGYSQNGTVKNCYVTSKVTGKTEVGGLVGYNENGRIENCYATGEVKGEDFVGGLVGRSTGTVQNSYAAGNVESNKSAGGILGTGWDGIVQNCLALSPSVVGNSADIGRVLGENHTYAPELSNNHAFVGLKNKAGNANWANKGADKQDGADIASDRLKTSFPLPQVFLAPPWSYEEGRLPGLFGQTVEMPSHL